MAQRVRALSCKHCKSRNHDEFNCLDQIKREGGALPIWLKLHFEDEDNMKIKVNDGRAGALNELVHVFNLMNDSITVTRSEPGTYNVVSTGPIYIRYEQRTGNHLEMAWVPGSLSITERFVINQGYMVTRSRADVTLRAMIDYPRGYLKFYSPRPWLNRPLKVSVFNYEYYILVTPTGPVVIPEPEFARSMAWLEQFQRDNTIENEEQNQEGAHAIEVPAPPLIMEENPNIQVAEAVQPVPPQIIEENLDIQVGGAVQPIHEVEIPPVPQMEVNQSALTTETDQSMHSEVDQAEHQAENTQEVERQNQDNVSIETAHVSQAEAESEGSYHLETSSLNEPSSDEDRF